MLLVRNRERKNKLGKDFVHIGEQVNRVQYLEGDSRMGEQRKVRRGNKPNDPIEQFPIDGEASPSAQVVGGTVVHKPGDISEQ